MRLVACSMATLVHVAEQKEIWQDYALQHPPMSPGFCYWFKATQVKEMPLHVSDSLSREKKSLRISSGIAPRGR